MASVPANQLSDPEKQQLAVSYASFVLHGVGAQINAATIAAVLKAAGINTEQTLVNAVSKTLADKKPTDFCSVGGGSGSAPAAESAKEDKKKGGDKADKGKDKAAPPPPPPPPAAEEEEMDMGGLFD